MKSKKQIIQELKLNGISIIEDFYNASFCEKSINDIEKIIKNQNGSIISKFEEGTSGDDRIFKIENVSKRALEFKKNKFLNDILNTISKNKIESYFILGGKVQTKKNQITNSGGGWHRDSDEEQFKVMVYLNDVDQNNGPFLFISNSNKFDLERRKNNKKKSILNILLFLFRKTEKYPPRYSDEIVNEHLKKSDIKPIEVKAKAGTVVLFNSTFLHRGKNLINGHRYTFTNYFFKKSIITRYFRNKQFKPLFIK